LKSLNRKQVKSKQRRLHPVTINGNLTNNKQMVANSFNNCFLTIANKIIDDNRNDKIGQSNNPNNPLNAPLICFKFLSALSQTLNLIMHEIEKNY